ncbi:MAG TPA: GTPase HflX [Beijerinckiaceae bacterium]|nr:GTPase HflX [Beijerinckiaceae bacterium]
MKDRRTPDLPSFDAASAAEQRVAAHTRTLVVGPYLQERAAARAGETATRGFEARLDEAVGLAGAIDLNIVRAEIAPLKTPRPATYLGVGKIEQFKALVEQEDIALVLADCALSPVQQRNLEKALGAKVIDRTGLILEIFGRRARTREGALQVELAHLHYQKSRLVRSWTHLERQRGGFGFLGGPGETQIEADRRLIQERMKRIERELEDVSRTRGLHRASRDKVPFPTVALVGYTNAGKSTLFNRMTRAEVLAKDMLFATLDPTTRVIELPHGKKAILSDTVGFISDLPTMLVAAFRATLEDVILADLILHVRDVAHEDAEAQGADVRRILGELGIDEAQSARVLEVWNKADLLPPDERERLLGLSARERPGEGRPVLVSALTGEGIAQLQAVIEERLSQGHERRQVLMPGSDGGGIAWIYENCEVLGREDRDDGTVALDIRLSPERVERFERRIRPLSGA